MKQSGAAQRAYDVIRSGIVQGKYKAGQRIIEERIAEKHGLSRTPVREALRTLEAEGLIIIERNRGAIVRPLSSKDIYDLYEFAPASNRSVQKEQLSDALPTIWLSSTGQSKSSIAQFPEIRRAT